jgi:hypothetical protein
MSSASESDSGDLQTGDNMDMKADFAISKEQHIDFRLQQMQNR